MITSIAKRYSAKVRQKRASLFRNLFTLTEETTILDVGSEDGRNINAVLQGTNVNPANVYVADIAQAPLERAQQSFGFQPLLLGESGTLPAQDNQFDIVYCSSVIEHVTVSKEDVWSLRSGKEFTDRARAAQRAFAAELVRVGRQHFVQTPYRHFPLETHSWLPFVMYLPRPAQISFLKASNKVWVKATSPDWHLLDKREFSALFPHSEIHFETSLGLVKSLMAVSRADKGSETQTTAAAS